MSSLGEELTAVKLREAGEAVMGLMFWVLQMASLTCAVVMDTIIHGLGLS